METPGGRGDSRFNLGYNMNLLSGETPPDIYSNPNISLTRPSTSLQQLSPRHTMVTTACGGPGRGGGLKTTSADSCFDERGMPSHQSLSLDACGVSEISEDTYGSIQPRKSPPSNGKKTKGRVKIKMEYIENKLRRYTTFSKRKTGIMKKAYELSTLTGTQVMLLVASETGHVYTFATRKLQPMITSEAGKALIQTCLNSPDPPGPTGPSDQRMSATGFEETELTYNISDDDSKEDGTSPFGNSSDSSEGEQDADSDDCQDSNNKDLIGGGKSLSNGVASNGDKASSTTGGGGQKLTVSPLVYQTPQGALYSTPGGGGVILSLAPPPGSEPGTAPQFITIPLPVAVQAAKQQQVAAAAHAQLQQQHQQQQQQQQQQLDLSAKRK